MAPNRIPTIPVKPAGPSNSTVLSAFDTLEKYLKIKNESKKDFLLKMAAAFKSFKNGDSLFASIIKLFNSAAKAVTRVGSGSSSSSSSTVNSSHEYVEMGDGLKWATCNLGASKPEEVGDYIAWGESSPFYSSYDPLIWKEGSGYYGYEFNRLFLYDSSGETPFLSLKYNPSDGKTVLESADDAASVNWGGTWRIPTKEEWETLLDKDKFTWTPGEKNGVKGYTVTSKVKGYVGNSIFLPAGANFIGEAPLGKALKSRGMYWSSSKTDFRFDLTAASILLFDTDSSSEVLEIQNVGCFFGLPIRAVSK